MPCSVVGGFDVFTGTGSYDTEPEASDDKHEKGKGVDRAQIKVGEEYQAKLPVCNTHNQRLLEDYPEKAMLMWSPSSLPEADVSRYLVQAVDMHGYNQEQALAMLFWHKHQVARASQDLANFTPSPSEWSESDKILFEQAFKMQGKKFELIQKNLPEKSIKSLVQHYFSRERAAMVTKQSKKQGMEREVHTRVTEDQQMKRDDDAFHVSKSCDDGQVYQRMLSSYSPLPSLARRGDSRAQIQGYSGRGT